MHPLLMDAVVTARQEELRRAARHPRFGRRGSPTRTIVRLVTGASRGGHARGNGEEQ
jgi:hypothetical protein